MIKKRYLLILILLIAVSVFAFVNINQMANSDRDTTDNISSITYELIGNDSLGSVEVMKGIGNPDGKRIAYVVGVHPLENDTHQTLLKLLPKQVNMSYSYDVYIINVSDNFSAYGQLYPDDEPGRTEGQDLAREFVFPKIANGSYELAVDVHSHGGAYPYDTFVFSPIDNTTAESYGRNISENTNNISYYNPNQTTSGPYLTIPLNQKGIPAFYYEENSLLEQNIKDLHMLELIHAVDNLKL